MIDALSTRTHNATARAVFGVSFERSNLVLSILRSLLGRELRSPDSDSAGGGGAPDPTSPSLAADATVDERAAHALWLDARTAAPFRRDALLKDVAKLMVRGCGPSVVRYCTAQFAGDRVRGEDAAQKAFMTFWLQLSRFEGRSSLRTWLFGIAFNHCRQDRRDDLRDSVIEAAHESDIRGELHAIPDPLETQVEREARGRQVLAAIERLEPRDAWLLRMRLFERREYPEMLVLLQATFGPSISTLDGLRTAFHHAKTRLFAVLEEP